MVQGKSKALEETEIKNYSSIGQDLLQPERKLVKNKKHGDRLGKK